MSLTRRMLALSMSVPLLLTWTACLAPVKVKPVSSLPERLPPAVPPAGTEQLSEPTVQTLRLLYLDERWPGDMASVLATLDGLQANSDDPEIAAAEAELALHAARFVEPKDPARAAGWYFLAAMRAYEYLFQSPGNDIERAFSRRFHQLREVYNRALGTYVRLRYESGGFRIHLEDAVFETVVVRVEKLPPPCDPDPCDGLLPSWEIRVRGLRNHYRRSGLGAPLTAVRQNRRRRPADRFRPPEGIVGPLTAVLSFEPVTDSGAGSQAADGHVGSARTARLAFYDPREVSRVAIAGAEVPLAADFTTPYAYLIGSARLHRLSLTGLIDAEKALWHEGLFLLGPYDPDKIPLIMVHGLRASPLSWMELTNDLFGEPDLRQDYQVWHYMYSTGLPYLYSAQNLRRHLEQLRRTLDPEGRDPAMGSMVVIAHSMGGLLAKTLVSTSDTRLWDVMFQVPPGKLRGQPSDIAAIRRTLFFKAKPYVDRVIFIAVPHRGSDMAGGILGRLGSQLVNLPDDFENLFRRLAEQNGEVIHEEVRGMLARGGPTSIRALSSSHPLTRVLAEIPIAEHVAFHTILGDRGRGGEDEAISDGFVTYESAHLEGAASERIVPSKHSAQAHPLAIAEIKRILRRHLSERSAGEAPGSAGR